jgi:long-chain acyl-CoA synthetase
MSLRSFTLYDLFKRNATIYRNETALLTEENRRITFKELFDEVNVVAGGLTARGIRKGDRIAVLAKNYPQYFTLMGSIAAVGAIMVPINFRLTPEEIGHQLTNTEPGMLFIDPDFEKMVSGLSSACPSIKEIVTFGSRGESFTPYGSLLRNQPGNALPISDDDPYVIIHTAAIQGKPRGAMLSHRNVIACNIQVIGAIGLTPRDSYLNILPVFHIAGWRPMAMMHAGGETCYIKFDPHMAVKIIDRRGEPLATSPHNTCSMHTVTESLAYTL